MNKEIPEKNSEGIKREIPDAIRGRILAANPGEISEEIPEKSLKESLGEINKGMSEGIPE